MFLFVCVSDLFISITLTTGAILAAREEKDEEAEEEKEGVNWDRRLVDGRRRIVFLGVFVPVHARCKMH